MATVIDKVLAVKKEIQLRALALFAFVTIIFLACFSLASGEKEFGYHNIVVVFLGTVGIIVVILSERIANLSLSVGENKVAIKLSDFTALSAETIHRYRSELTEASPLEEKQVLERKLEQAEQLVKKLKETAKGRPKDINAQKLGEEARDMGNMMGMLHKMMNEYRKTKSDQ